MNNRVVIIGGAVIVLIIIIAGAVSFFRGGAGSLTSKETGSIPTPTGTTKDPIDAVSDFYAAWLEAANSHSTDPFKAGLATSPVLSKALSDRIVASEGKTSTTTDIVLCQTKAPTQIATRVVYAQDTKEEILVTARDKDLTGQAIITLSKNGDLWSIDDIQCAPGEFAPDREFTFEQQGYLLKDVPPPYSSKDWHLVFEQDGKMGNVVPLFFDKDSMCTAADGTTAVCDPTQLKQTTKATVHGSMTEYGVQVKKMELTTEEFKAGQ
jgi:hypothetical protein